MWRNYSCNNRCLFFTQVKNKPWIPWVYTWIWHCCEQVVSIHGQAASCLHHTKKLIAASVNQPTKSSTPALINIYFYIYMQFVCNKRSSSIFIICCNNCSVGLVYFSFLCFLQKDFQYAVFMPRSHKILKPQRRFAYLCLILVILSI
jgi:hypothetical protein